MKSLKDKLKNHTEDIVLENMEEMLTSEEFAGVCTCEKCLLDIASYALNRLPAKYIVSHSGNVHTKIAEFEQQYRVDIIKVLTQGIKIVSKNPRH